MSACFIETSVVYMNAHTHQHSPVQGGHHPAEPSKQPVGLSLCLTQLKKHSGQWNTVSVLQFGPSHTGGGGELVAVE